MEDFAGFIEQKILLIEHVKGHAAFFLVIAALQKGKKDELHKYEYTTLIFKKE